MSPTVPISRAESSEHGAEAPRQGAPHIAPARTRTILIVAGIIALGLLAFLATGTIERWKHARSLAASTKDAVEASPQVYVVDPVLEGNAPWSLPANTQAMQDTIVYARVSGYLKKRYVDLGDHVKAGQLLAEIESPELDQQLNQAQANLEQSRQQLRLQNANLELARVTMVRYQGADKEGAVAKEAVDQNVSAFRTAQAAVAAAEATVNANQATVGQYEAETSFERVLAPFDGVITERNVDTGALITAGSPVNNISAAPNIVSGTPTGLFEVAQVDVLRVFVSVPQVTAGNVKPGLPTQITVRGSVTTPLAAKVTRTANALDPATRTLLTEVDVPNRANLLFPGEFVYVTFELPPAGRRWRLPATALIFNTDGTQLMTVGSDNRLHLRKVIVGRDFGDTIDIQAGLTGDETVVEQPDVSLTDGQLVVPVKSQSGS